MYLCISLKLRSPWKNPTNRNTSMLVPLKYLYCTFFHFLEHCAVCKIPHQDRPGGPSLFLVLQQNLTPFFFEQTPNPLVYFACIKFSLLADVGNPFCVSERVI